ncbi:MAG: DUF1697 domain-containing protein [Nitriliruptorales bacterium]|nr:DUF1697 domain-containing protein [Nitriliruptorales bacterium]
MALLRGINVGGKNKIEMSRLRNVLEVNGLTNVSTYIASGNILFSSPDRSAARLTTTIEDLIAGEFGLDIRVLVRSASNIRDVAAAIPGDWATDDEHKADVMYLWKQASRGDILERVGVRPVDDVRHVHDALLWRVRRKDFGRSGLSRLAANPIYQQMTARNVNTARKLAELLDG